MPYAHLKISFEKAVAMAKSGDPDMNRYLGIKNKYGKVEGDTQAFDLARFLMKIKFVGTKKGGYTKYAGRLVRLRPSAICINH